MTQTTLTPSDAPALTTSLPALTTSSVAHPDTWNPTHQALLDNDAYLNATLASLSDSTDTRVGELDARVSGVEATSSVAVQRAVSLDWLYRGNRVAFELFTPGYTLIDLAPVPVTGGVNGDDSLDVASTASLRVGDYYVLADAGGTAALVLVSAILSATRLRLSANLSRDWAAGATLSRSSLDVRGAANAVAAVGDLYLSRPINIGTDLDGGAVVLRRTLNAGEARLYYRDAYQTTWRECGWSVRRQGDGVPAGFADYEYMLPMRGDGALRLDISGEPMTIQHLVALGAPTGLGGFINPSQRPATPVISAPAAAATGIMERPTLALAGYSSPAGNAQAAVQFQVSATADFAAVLHDSGELPAGLSYPLPAGVLAVGKTYQVRARVRDVAGLWSDWSAASAFTTAASFVYVATPTLTGPAMNAVDIPEQPTLASSPFAVSVATDTHTASQWQIRSAAGSYAAPVWDSGTDTVNKTSVVTPAGKLQPGQNSYFLRVRHQGAARGWSDWSNEIRITTKTQFANVIGIVLAQTGGGAGTWRRIDENGNDRVTDASFFNTHPIYGAISSVTIDGQAMVRIPAFYVKAGTLAAGPYAGRRFWSISDQPLPGYTLHPAFMVDGAPVAQFWVGKYQGTTDGTKLGSVAGVAPAVDLASLTLKARAVARNTGGVTGFGLWNIYQLAAIQLLALIEMGGADSQSLIGQGCVNEMATQAVDNSLVAQATWRGIVGLWGNIWQIVDGLRTDANSRYMVWDRNGNKTYQTTGQTAPRSGTYPATFSIDSGALHDLSICFLPATGDELAANGSSGDLFYQNPVCIAYHGGHARGGAGDGLFHLSIIESESAVTGLAGTRLAKV
ncbi:hypothetical protein [Microvirgula aerodenitrificans]|uniref:hypothetical protein n=1 Tax=Microvirgula aerodenitrificans TaxID=57480 RepID=UPI00048DD2D3|nr:hypothetical protein [Microvirgula aerodenitrificans]